MPPAPRPVTDYPTVRIGLDRLLREGLPETWRRIGLLTHDAARSPEHGDQPGRRVLLEAGIPLVRLFSPEHGLAANAPDGASVPDGPDPLTGLPVTSLYGGRLAPLEKSLRDLDGLLVDLQDIGCRHFTYIWTLFETMEACGRAGLPVRVLDRPNPIGGDPSSAEGPFSQVETAFAMRDSLPVRHSLTIGELAAYWRATRFPQLELTVTAMTGWRRGFFHPATELPFYQPSPAMPCWESALFYPGTCLLEATNLSAGRGTAEPFQIMGAPWLDAEPLAKKMRQCAGDWAEIEPAEFIPAAPPHLGEHCRGLRLRPIRPEKARPVALGFHLLNLVLAAHPLEFRWATYPTAANPSGENHFSKLTGRGNLTDRLQHGVSATEITAWTDPRDWATRTANHRIYPM